jgi:SAM-dependent methyltransferase
MAGRFPYRRCQACGLVFLAQPPDDLGAAYPGTYHQLPNTQALQRLAERQRWQIDMVRRHVPGGRVIEVGPGSGVFAWQARTAGFIVDTIEMDERCCQHLQSVVGVNAIHSSDPAQALAGLPQADVIAMWHVLEHLPDPWQTLRQAALSLRSGGILLIATPNPDAFGLRILRAAWPHIDAPRHLWLFPVPVLTDHLDGLGLRPLTITADDPGGRYWNLFAWRRALMNRVPTWLAPAGYVAGTLVGAAVRPWERRSLNGAAYTAVFVK